MEHRFIMWDWKEQIDIRELNKATRDGLVHFIHVGDNSDNYVIMASEKPVKGKQADKLYKEFLESLG